MTAFQKPKLAYQTWQDTRLVNMTIVHPFKLGPERLSYCMTLANSTEEAFHRAREHYGNAVTLFSWGSRSMPLDGPILGGGYFLRSKLDKEHKTSLRYIGQLRRKPIFR